MKRKHTSWATRLVPGCALAVIGFAVIQHAYVIKTPLTPRFFLIPMLVGGLFGYLLGRVLDLRAQVARLNRELEGLLETKEQSLTDTRAQLFQAQRLSSLGTMAARVAHDFNNLLSAIMAGASVMQTRNVDPMNKEILDDVIVSTESGASLTRQLLEFGRPSQLQSAAVPLDIDGAIQNAMAMLRLALTPNYKLESELQANGATVALNEGRLQQVLMNLTVNARDAMPDGGRIVIRTHDDPSSGSVRVEVEDDGPGMTEDIVDKILTPFFSTKAQGLGTGLGLATVDSIVSGCGGQLNITSVIGQGSNFSMVLPMSVPKRAELVGS